MPLNSIIFGNIIMFIACIIMTVAGLPKKKKLYKERGKKFPLLFFNIKTLLCFI